MEHLDPEAIDLIALGEGRPSTRESEHLDACAVCRGELAAVRSTAAAVRSSRDLAVSGPPASVWAAIHAELGLDPALADEPRVGVLPLVAAAPASTPAVSEAEAGPIPARAPDGTTPSATAEAPGVERRSTQHVASRRPRRTPRRRWLVTALAAAVALVVGIAGGAWLATLPMGQNGAVVATARLAALPDWPDASGSATLHELSDGSREVTVEVDAAAAGTADSPLREVWLLTADASGLVSIGFLDGTTGTFRVPAGVDLSTYPIVDVSAEPDNGDPTHSGDSIVRGELATS
jgi:hypothetical protein